MREVAMKMSCAKKESAKKSSLADLPMTCSNRLEDELETLSEILIDCAIARIRPAKGGMRESRRLISQRQKER